MTIIKPSALLCARVALVCALSLTAGCVSTPTTLPLEAALPITPQASGPAPLSSAPDDDSGAPDEQQAQPHHSHAQPQAQSQAVPEPAMLTAPPVVMDPNSYAQRAELRGLVTRLANEFDLDPIWAGHALAQARKQEAVARLMMPGPPGVAKNWALYRSRFVEPIRIRAGVAFWRQYERELRQAEARWGVPASIIAGIIGVETIWGRNTGSFRVLDALTTLSLDFPTGRSDRSPFFQKELGHFLKFCAEQEADPTSILGSYAGAMGLPQFMPSSARHYAVDFDGDGHVDLRNSAVDAIGSVANYLAQHGWLANTPAYYDVTPPSQAQDRDHLLEPDILPSFRPQEMRARGAQLGAQALRHPGLLALVKLENADKAPTMIAGTENFYVITRYNKSSYYALAVIQLGEAVAVAARMNP